MIETVYVHRPTVETRLDVEVPVSISISTWTSTTRAHQRVNSPTVPSEGHNRDAARRADDEPTAAAIFSSFYVHLTRSDADGEISAFSTKLPPGADRHPHGDPVLPGGGHRAGQSKERRPRGSGSLLSCR